MFGAFRLPDGGGICTASFHPAFGRALCSVMNSDLPSTSEPTLPIAKFVFYFMPKSMPE
ncbi:hypothetical protein [Paenibacillus kandeliae]|uniref:hypothetical protein n=1 Tax=Paenibacillus kandeliae TaxID=3231269 RepID=UPI00345AB382